MDLAQSKRSLQDDWCDYGEASKHGIARVSVVEHWSACGRAGLAAVPRAGSEPRRSEQIASRPLVEDRERRMGREHSGARLVVADRYGRQGLLDDGDHRRQV